MFESISEAAEYCVAFAQRMEPNETFDIDEVEILLFSIISRELEEWSFPDSIKPQLQEFTEKEDLKAVEGLLAQYVPNFYTALDHAIVKFLAPYVMDAPQSDA